MILSRHVARYTRPDSIGPPGVARTALTQARSRRTRRVAAATRTRRGFGAWRLRMDRRTLDRSAGRNSHRTYSATAGVRTSSFTSSLASRIGYVVPNMQWRAKRAVRDFDPP